MKISNFIICDDIRMEMGNKHSLMGIYFNSINFHYPPDQKNQWPKTKRLCIFSQIDIEQEMLSNIRSFEIEINYNGEKNQIGGSDIPPPTSKTGQGIILQAIFNNFKFKEIGEIKFTFHFYDKKKKKVSEITSPLSLKVEETIIKPQ